MGTKRTESIRLLLEVTVSDYNCNASYREIMIYYKKKCKTIACSNLEDVDLGKIIFKKTV